MKDSDSRDSKHIYYQIVDTFNKKAYICTLIIYKTTYYECIWQD